MRYIVLFITMLSMSSYACDIQPFINAGMNNVTVRGQIPSDQCGNMVSLKGYKNGKGDKDLKGYLGHIYSDAITFGENDEGDPIIHKMVCCYVGFKALNKVGGFDPLSVQVIIHTMKFNFVIHYEKIGAGVFINQYQTPSFRVVDIYNNTTNDKYTFYLER